MRFSAAKAYANAEGLLAHLDNVGALLAEELRNLQRETMHRKRLVMRSPP